MVLESGEIREFVFHSQIKKACFTKWYKKVKKWINNLS
jgi:hypothetical protein